MRRTVRGIPQLPEVLYHGGLGRDGGRNRYMRRF